MSFLGKSAPQLNSLPNTNIADSFFEKSISDYGGGMSSNLMGAASMGAASGGSSPMARSQAQTTVVRNSIFRPKKVRYSPNFFFGRFYPKIGNFWTFSALALVRQ